MPSSFPPVSMAHPEGLLAMGGDLNYDLLIEAYEQGIFPWPDRSFDQMLWFAPERRAILYTNQFYVSRSFQKYLKQTSHTVTFSKCFKEVIRFCAQTRVAAGGETWISDEIIDGYSLLYDKGNAYSVECWSKNGKLVGGLYGVCIGSFYSGESMFYLEDNASKNCLYSLCKMLENKGVKWIDCQVINPFLQSLGVIEITRDSFTKMLNKTLAS